MHVTWDRYDKTDKKDGEHFFSLECEPSLGERFDEVCNASPDTNNGVKPWLVRINNSIERLVAKATLTFPSNQTGSEMSRLGVASTDEGSAWERSWTEEEPTRFRLSWKRHSRLPNFSVTSSYPKWRGLTGVASLGLGLFLVFLFIWMVNLIKRIFLTDVDTAPKFETVNWQAVSDIKARSIVIGRAQSGKTERLKRLAGLCPDNWYDLRNKVTENTDSKQSRGSSADCSVVFLDHFEFNIRDRECNKKRLHFIENLLYGGCCLVVIVSTIDPLYFLTEEASHVLSADPEEARGLLDRWARVLSKFKKVSLSTSGKGEFTKKYEEFATLGGSDPRLSTWVYSECSATHWLRRLGTSIFAEFGKDPPRTREQLIEIVLDRAHAYYHVLWSDLTTTERLVLYQLALDGWANPKDEAAIQQLERKKLISKAPMYRIMNDSFRRFIQSTEHADEIAVWEKHERQSSWRALRFAIFAVLIGAGVWLLYAQAQLFQIGAAYLTALATLLTAVAGLFARSKRPAAGQSKAEG